MMIPVSIGEYVDKIAILEVKLEKGCGGVQKELDVLRGHFVEEYGIYLDQLRDLNRKIWDCIEEQTCKTRDKSFDDRYMELAREVILLNDKRYRLKCEINEHFGSEFREQKSSFNMESSNR